MKLYREKFAYFFQQRNFSDEREGTARAPISDFLSILFKTIIERCVAQMPFKPLTGRTPGRSSQA